MAITVEYIILTLDKMSWKWNKLVNVSFVYGRSTYYVQSNTNLPICDIVRCRTRERNFQYLSDEFLNFIRIGSVWPTLIFYRN